MRPAPEQIAYDAPSTAEIARAAGIPAAEVIRFDGNTSPRVPPFVRGEVLAGALAEINTYPHGGYAGLAETIAAYAGVAPENVVLGAGADDVILLVTRSFAGRGDRIAIANDPTYALFHNAVGLAGAEVGDEDPVLTICCRPRRTSSPCRWRTAQTLRNVCFCEASLSVRIVTVSASPSATAATTTCSSPRSETSRRLPWPHLRPIHAAGWHSPSSGRRSS